MVEVTQQHRAWDCCQIGRSTDCTKVKGESGGKKFESPRGSQKLWIVGKMQVQMEQQRELAGGSLVGLKEEPGRPVNLARNPALMDYFHLEASHLLGMGWGALQCALGLFLMDCSLQCWGTM